MACRYAGADNDGDLYCQKYYLNRLEATGACERCRKYEGLKLKTFYVLLDTRGKDYGEKRKGTDRRDKRADM